LLDGQLKKLRKALKCDHRKHPNLKSAARARPIRFSLRPHAGVARAAFYVRLFRQITLCRVSLCADYEQDGKTNAHPRFTLLCFALYVSFSICFHLFGINNPYFVCPSAIVDEPLAWHY
jgi:hypothetical protein